MYYEKYKAKKLTKKVGSIVKDGNKYLTILSAGKGLVLQEEVLMKAKRLEKLL